MFALPRSILARGFLGASATALLAASFGLSASAAEPQASKPPGPVELCITNSCMNPNPPKGRDEAAIADAVRRAHSGDLIRAGGSPRELGDMFRAHCGETGQPRCSSIPVAGTETWMAYRDGSIGLGGAYQESAAAGGAGIIMMGNADMKGISAPAEVLAEQARNDALMGELSNGATPITTPQVQPDGTTRHVVTGWRHNDGSITPTPMAGKPAPRRN